MNDRIDDLIAEVKKRRAVGDSYETTIAWLREHGCSKVQSMFILVQALDVDLVRAKQLVHESPVWEDRRALDEEFHNRLERDFKTDPPSDKDEE